jgi:hypothetical protein
MSDVNPPPGSPQDSDPWSAPAPGGSSQPAPAAPPPYGPAPTAATPPPPQPYGQPPTAAAPQPYGQSITPQPYRPASGFAVTSSKATSVMAWGIGAVVASLFCLPGFIGAIVALVQAGGARREIAASGGQLTGEGQITAGKVCAFISLGLTALVVIVVIIFIALAASAGNSSPTYPTDTGSY